MMWIFEAIANFWDPIPNFRDTPNLLDKSILEVEEMAAPARAYPPNSPRLGDIVISVEFFDNNAVVEEQYDGRVVGFDFWANNEVKGVLLDNGGRVRLFQLAKLKNHKRMWLEMPS